MTFSSPIFLFFFLPVFLVGYYLFFGPAVMTRNDRVRERLVGFSNAIILLASLVFYFWGETWMVLVMLTSTTIDYFSGLAIGRHGRTVWGKAFLTLSIVANLSLLGFFKYINFGMENFNGMLGSLGLAGWQVQNFMEVSLPLGISFYTFQSMSYTIDVYRGEVRPTRNFLGFACFVTMFPQLVAGPIVRYRDVARQIYQRTLTIDSFSYGAIRFILGLGKKVLIANVVAGPADRIFALPADQLTTGLAWLGVVSYTLQIYFDFSGYSDMAIGLGRMLGFTFPENFNYPYSARTIQDFWRRWHISLSSWFRDYLYIPLGGGRGRPARVYSNLIIVFFLCGLWHGSSWSFVVWGLFHGLFLVVERLGLDARIRRTGFLLPHVYVLLTVMTGWVLFRADDLGHSVTFYRAMVGMGADASVAVTQTPLSDLALTRDVVFALMWGTLFSWPFFPALVRLRERSRLLLTSLVRWPFEFIQGCAKISFVLAVFLLSVMALATGSYNPFIYFRF